jgi:hypothetical protein
MTSITGPGTILRDDMAGSTPIDAKPSTPDMHENNVEEHKDMEFSTPLDQVMDQSHMNMMMPPVGEASGGVNFMHANAAAGTQKSQYPMNLKQNQVEALLAGVAAVIGFSSAVQEKLADTIPQFLSESGKISLTGNIILLLIVAAVFFGLRRAILKV